MNYMKDMRQDINIQHASSEAREAARKAGNVTEKIENLENKLDLLTLKCQAMWELIRENTDLSDEQIKTKIEQTYSRHEVKNGKKSKKTSSCSECGRPIDKRTQKCLYCGTKFVSTEIFV